MSDMPDVIYASKDPIGYCDSWGDEHEDGDTKYISEAKHKAEQIALLDKAEDLIEDAVDDTNWGYDGNCAVMLNISKAINSLKQSLEE